MIAAASILVVVACLSVATDLPAAQAKDGHGRSAATLSLVIPALRIASHPHPTNVSSKNLKLPRAPRHRSDRPASGASDIEAISTAEIVQAVIADVHRVFVVEAFRARPLAGHPLSLLRPPSLLAG